jgi:hypothetical protein
MRRFRCRGCARVSHECICAEGPIPPPPAEVRQSVIDRLEAGVTCNGWGAMHTEDVRWVLRAYQALVQERLHLIREGP